MPDQMTWRPTSNGITVSRDGQWRVREDLPPRSGIYLDRLGPDFWHEVCATASLEEAEAAVDRILAKPHEVTLSTAEVPPQTTYYIWPLGLTWHRSVTVKDGVALHCYGFTWGRLHWASTERGSR